MAPAPDARPEPAARAPAVAGARGSAQAAGDNPDDTDDMVELLDEEDAALNPALNPTPAPPAVPDPAAAPPAAAGAAAVAGRMSAAEPISAQACASGDAPRPAPQRRNLFAMMRAAPLGDTQARPAGSEADNLRALVLHLCVSSMPAWCCMHLVWAHRIDVTWIHLEVCWNCCVSAQNTLVLQAAQDSRAPAWQAGA